MAYFSVWIVPVRSVHWFNSPGTYVYIRIHLKGNGPCLELVGCKLRHSLPVCMLCVQQLSMLLESVVCRLMPLYIHTYIHAYIGNTLCILNIHFADSCKCASKPRTYDVIVDGLHT